MYYMKFHPIEQPGSWEFASADGLFIKQMPLKDAGMAVPQHAHTYDHYTMLAAGSLKVIKDGVEIGIFKAPKPIFIEAGAKHLLISMEPNTLAYCIHNIARTGEVEIAEEHQLEIEPCGAR